MTLLLKIPNDLFQQIESRVTKNPNLLKAFNWHELMSGKEAFTDEQILDEDTAHCLMGWIVALTPKAASYEHMREDVDIFANEILTANGRRPIPNAIVNSDEESMLKVIKMRAEQERIDAAKYPPTFTVN